jgi:phasin
MAAQQQQHPLFYEISPEMRDFAEKSVDQAKKAIDGFMNAAHKAVDTFGGHGNPVQASATDMSRKTLSYAEQNIAAALDHARKLVRTRDPMEAFRLQAEFVQSQFSSLQTQIQEFGEVVRKKAEDMTTEGRKPASSRK